MLPMARVVSTPDTLAVPMAQDSMYCHKNVFENVLSAERWSQFARLLQHYSETNGTDCEGVWRSHGSSQVRLGHTGTSALRNEIHKHSSTI